MSGKAIRLLSIFVGNFLSVFFHGATASSLYSGDILCALYLLDFWIIPRRDMWPIRQLAIRRIPAYLMKVALKLKDDTDGKKHVCSGRLQGAIGRPRCWRGQPQTHSNLVSVPLGLFL